MGLLSKIRDVRNGMASNRIIIFIYIGVFLLMPFYYVGMIEWFHFEKLQDVIEFFTERKPVLYFSLTLFYFIYAGIFLCVKKMWITTFICGASASLVSVVNYLKYALTNERFFPQDLAMIPNVREIAGFVSVKIPDKGIFLIFVSMLAVFAFWFLKGELPVRVYIRFPLGAAILTLISYFFADINFAEKIFNNFSMYFESAALQSSNYEENGFIGAFSLNMASGRVMRPHGYSKELLMDKISHYQSTPVSENFIYPDIIIFLSESFWDPRQLPGSEFSENPLKNYDEMAASENSLSGKLIVPTVGGGTIRTEFELLSGLSCDALPSGTIPYNYITDDMPSFISYYKSIGYDTLAIHSYLKRFYNRNNALVRMGFDRFLGIEDLEQMRVKDIEVDITAEKSDLSFVKYIKLFMDGAGEAPMLMFAVSMENHQPYKNKYDTLTITTENPYLNENDLDVFRNYVQGIKNADEALGVLADYIDKRERPTVLLYFGDHLPSIGINLSGYVDTGFITSESGGEDKISLYAPPFLIYANFPLEQGALESKTENMISTYNAVNALSSSIGSGKTQYMSYLDKLHGVIPFYNIRIQKELDEEAARLLEIQYYMTYHLISGK